MQMKINKIEKITNKRQNFVYIFCQQLSEAVPRLKTTCEKLEQLEVPVETEHMPAPPNHKMAACPTKPAPNYLKY